MTQRPLRLRVEASAVPEPSLLRPPIAARLAGRAFATRTEDAVAARVAEAVREQLAERGEDPPWR
jgi:RNA 3'-terminal phosphate cyclase